VSISTAIVSRISANVASLSGKIFPENAPEGVDYPFMVYQLQTVERYQDLSGTPSTCPSATFRFYIFSNSRSQVEILSNQVGGLFDGFRGMVGSQLIYTSSFDSQESNEVFIEGSDIPVYSYMNTQTIQFKED